ncbi:MAG TPA: methyltransferase domain-containing protein [Reyranella sp.]|jgi:SAM-dependent methyltransferase|nr:methyltransferase domain-containing protein [Reyranella sp.]
MTVAAELNAQQLEYWGGAGGERWVAQQARRDQLLGDFALAALAKADPKPGEVVLDIGCGCGETAALLADRVGPEGRVIGVDVSPPILAAARDRLAGRANVELRLGDAGAHLFEPASIDLLFSRFGVMFFGDPLAAFSNLRKAMKPGGRLAFVCWRSPADNGWMTAPLAVTGPLLPEAGPADPNAPGPFAFHDQARVAGILIAAGFASPAFEKFDRVIDVASGGGAEAAVKSAMELGPTARGLDGADEDLRGAVAEALRGFFAPRVADGRVDLPAAIWIVTATAP